MKRFITYLYEYERKRRSKNTGFMKVDVRGAETNIEVCVRNFIRTPEKGSVYAFVKESGLMGIFIGEIQIENGQGDTKISLNSQQIMDSRFSIQDIAGIGIVFQNAGYLASCWKDECGEEIAAGEFGLWKGLQISESSQTEIIPQISSVQPIDEHPQIEAAEVLSPDVVNLCVRNSKEPDGPSHSGMEDDSNEWAAYRKIGMDEIHRLPSPNWHLCNNSFLVHGFWNYGYLVLKKETTENEESLFLGVPGIFEKPEMVMAVVFGFTEFEAISQEIANANINEERITPVKEKNQEPKTGEFGCWFVKLQK